MKTYFICERIVEFETDSLKAAKAWATRNRYYLGRLRVPDIYIRLLDGREELAGFYPRVVDVRVRELYRLHYSEKAFKCMCLRMGWHAKEN